MRAAGIEADRHVRPGQARRLQDAPGRPSDRSFRRASSRRAAAASDEPPPMPAATGRRLTRWKAPSLSPSTRSASSLDALRTRLSGSTLRRPTVGPDTRRGAGCGRARRRGLQSCRVGSREGNEALEGMVAVERRPPCSYTWQRSESRIPWREQRVVERKGERPIARASRNVSASWPPAADHHGHPGQPGSRRNQSPIPETVQTFRTRSCVPARL